MLPSMLVKHDVENSLMAHVYYLMTHAEGCVKG